jgi:hypothetical protein
MESHFVSSPIDGRNVERVKILEAQGKAKDQQIANLRLRLNKAHDKFEDQQRKTMEVS